MKRVVGVSLGSPRRDFRLTVDWGRETVALERRGSGGDAVLARRWLAAEDGRASALGLGGINLTLGGPGRRYPFVQAQELARAVRRTPLVDGSGVKDHWEPWLVRRLAGEGLVRPGDVALAVSMLDRWTQAEELRRAGCRLLIGDAAAGLRLPLYFRQPAVFALAANLTLPVFRRLPVDFFYPLGRREATRRQAPRPRVDVLAGDFRFVRLFLAPPPPRLVITSTLTPEDVEELRAAGVRWLAALSPAVGGRSVGANMLEAWLVAVTGKPPAELSRADYLAPLESGMVRPRIERLN